MEQERFKKFRDEINSISSIKQLADILSVAGKVISGNKYNYTTINGYTVGWCPSSIYILKGFELLKFEDSHSGEVPQELIDFILDEILKFNTDDFYRFYFKKYGYESVLDEIESDVVRNVFDNFIRNRCIMKNIFVSQNYDSVTISGIKRNGTDYECNVMCCEKSDIIELIELTHIKPHVNKKSITEYSSPTKPYYGVPSSVISAAIAEYHDEPHFTVPGESVDEITYNLISNLDHNGYDESYSEDDKNKIKDVLSYLSSRGFDTDTVFQIMEDYGYAKYEEEG